MPRAPPRSRPGEGRARPPPPGGARVPAGPARRPRESRRAAHSPGAAGSRLLLPPPPGRGRGQPGGGGGAGAGRGAPCVGDSRGGGGARGGLGDGAHLGEGASPAPRPPAPVTGGAGGRALRSRAAPAGQGDGWRGPLAPEAACAAPPAEPRPSAVPVTCAANRRRLEMIMDNSDGTIVSKHWQCYVRCTVCSALMLLDSQPPSKDIV
ncbi:hypothetical protein VULLAG_LOCUS18137 [Vulpes lagopus]